MSSAPLLVLDTNVLVSALLSPFGSPGRIWDLVLARDILLTYDDRILMEYERVLKRPKFGFEKNRVEALLAVFLFQESVSSKPWPFQPLPDPDDGAFLEVAHAASAILITGNTRYFPDELCGDVIMRKPHEWLENRYRDQERCNRSRRHLPRCSSQSSMASSIKTSRALAGSRPLGIHGRKSSTS